MSKEQSIKAIKTHIQQLLKIVLYIQNKCISQSYIIVYFCTVLIIHLRHINIYNSRYINKLSQLVEQLIFMLVSVWYSVLFIWSSNRFWILMCIIKLVWGCLVMGVVSRFWFIGLMFVILVCNLRKVHKQGSLKSWFFWVMDSPQKIITFFSIWYQCWLNCQQIFFDDNP